MDGLAETDTMYLKALSRVTILQSQVFRARAPNPWSPFHRRSHHRTLTDVALKCGRVGVRFIALSYIKDASEVS